MDNHFEWYEIDDLAREISIFLSQKKLKVYTINYQHQSLVGKKIFNTHFGKELSEFLKMRHDKLNPPTTFKG